jgi:hypothetical protein
LFDFVQQRRESLDYKKYLGVIARAHADFEQLSVLLAKVRKEIDDEEARTKQGSTPDGASEKLLPRIDRIVLYIDDLDRCPEDKVVQVLQAIHLLLFFPLFVVVVGVDSRWLLHSLRQQSAVFRDSSDRNFTSEDVDWTHWQSTPFNYLEKIFQIPFSVPQMSTDGFEGLVDNLTEQQQSVSAIPQKEAAQAQSQTPVSASASGIVPRDQTVVLGAASSPPFDPNPQHLIIEASEREFMTKMCRLIPSPRATKRFVNVYRLLRTSPEAQSPSFIGKTNDGEYQAVQLLLAIQVGYPTQAMQIIRDLIEQQPTKKLWWELCQRL